MYKSLAGPDWLDPSLGDAHTSGERAPHTSAATSAAAAGSPAAAGGKGPGEGLRQRKAPVVKWDGEHECAGAAVGGGRRGVGEGKGAVASETRECGAVTVTVAVQGR